MNKLELAIDAFRKTPVYAVTSYMDMGVDEVYANVEKIGEPADSLDWAVEVGCIAHNFRSALDYLVSILSQIEQKRPLTQDEIEHTSFPIFDDPVEWTKYKGRKQSGISLVSGNNRDAIYELQPCDGVHASRNRPLGWLHALNNTDKHRALLIVATRLHGLRISTTGSGGMREFHIPGASTDFGPDIPVKIDDAFMYTPVDQIEFQPEFDVVFADGSGPLDRFRVIPTLRGIESTIYQHVFPKFESDVGALAP